MLASYLRIILIQHAVVIAFDYHLRKHTKGALSFQESLSLLCISRVTLSIISGSKIFAGQF